MGDLAGLVGNGIASLVSTAVGAISAAISGVVGALNAAVPFGLLPVVGIVGLLGVVWFLRR